VRTVPDKCPFCESPIMVHGGNLLRSDNCGFATYECRTVYDVELADNQWKRAEQSMACKTRENQLLTKQRDEARERIKRLEEELERTKQDRNAIAKNTREPLLLQLDHAAERIKRLEEAGDELAGKHLFAVHTYDNAKKHVAEWYKSKEGNP